MRNSFKVIFSLCVFYGSTLTLCRLIIFARYRDHSWEVLLFFPIQSFRHFSKRILDYTMEILRVFFFFAWLFLDPDFSALFLLFLLVLFFLFYFVVVVKMWPSRCCCLWHLRSSASWWRNTSRTPGILSNRIPFRSLWKSCTYISYIQRI